LFNAIIKQQNEHILKAIAATYDMDYDEMKAKYITPTLYDVTFSSTNVYNTVFEEKVYKD
jgi:hypothetical protein